MNIMQIHGRGFLRPCICVMGKEAEKRFLIHMRTMMMNSFRRIETRY